MKIKYYNKKGEEVGSNKVEYIPRVGELVDFGDAGSFKVSNVVKDKEKKSINIYLK